VLRVLIIFKDLVVSPILNLIKYRKPTLKATHRIEFLKKYYQKIWATAGWENGFVF